METKCILCGNYVDLNLSPETNLKNILNMLYSKGKFELAIKLGNNVINSLKLIRKSYRNLIKYADGILNPPICKKCFLNLVRSSISKKDRECISNIEKIVI